MELPVVPGDVVAGKYRVTRSIGEGGMGVVVAADHLQLPQQVAIKFLRREASERDAQRFAREARIVVGIQSEHICRVLDVGSLPTGEPYIVMDLLHGEDLQQAVERGGPLDVGLAVSYIVQACEAIAAAHVSGVVHRDLKPSNLFRTTGLDGRAIIKVLDFGISKDTRSTDPQLTASGAMLGSPRFMAPEQLQSNKLVDMRTDVWALGVTLHELLSGQAAFDGDTAAELFVAIIQDPPRRIERADVPRELVAVLHRCMQKQPDERFANVAELVLALRPWLDGATLNLVDRIERVMESTGWQRPRDSALVPDASAPPGSTTHDGEPMEIPHGEHVIESARTQNQGTTLGPAPGGATSPSHVAPGSPHRADIALARASVPERVEATGQSRGLWMGLALGGMLAAVSVVVVVVLLMPSRDGAEKSRTTRLEDADDGKKKKKKKNKKKKASKDPLLAKYESAKKTFDAGMIDEADEACRKMIDEALDTGVEAGSAQSRVLGKAWVLRGDVMRKKLKWPKNVISLKGDPPHDPHVDLLKISRVYYKAITDVAAVQCADHRTAGIHVDIATWYLSAEYPAGMDPRKKKQTADYLLRRAHGDLETAQGKLETALGRFVQKGEGCRDDVKKLLAEVKAHRARIPPKPKP